MTRAPGRRPPATHLRRGISVAIAFFAAAALPIACGEEAASPQAPARPAEPPRTEAQDAPASPPAVTSEDVKAEMEEALDTTAAFAQQKKAEYQQRIQERLAELDAEVAALERRMQDRRAALSEDAQDARRALEAKQAAAREELARLKDSSASAWHELRAGVNQAVDELAQALERAEARLDSESSAGTPTWQRIGPDTNHAAAEQSPSETP